MLFLSPLTRPWGMTCARDKWATPDQLVNVHHHKGGDLESSCKFYPQSFSIGNIGGVHQQLESQPYPLQSPLVGLE